MSIRWKISLLLGLLACVMAFQSIDRVLYLARSAAGFEALSLRVEQTLTDIETLSAATDQLDMLTQQIAQTTVLEELARHERRLAGILGDARDAARTLDGGGSPLFEPGGQFDVVAGAALHSISQRAEVIRLAETYASTHEAFRADTQALRAQIMPVRVRVLTELSAPDQPFSAEDLRLLLTLTGLLERVEDLLATEPRDQTSKIEADVSRLIASGIKVLASLDEFPSGRGIADTLARVHDRLSGVDGFGAIRAALHEALEEEAAAASLLRASMYDIGAEVSSLVSASEQEIGQVYAGAASLAQQRIWSEVVLNAGLGLGIVAAVWMVFAHQISARLERLTSAVLRLASGNLAPVEQPRGRDELSRMMHSLETFRQTARELRRSNEDLANFAYAASHDLRTPLRAIRDLVDWTIEDRAESLHPEVRSNLRLIKARADRLSRLLQDLLDYARAGQRRAKSAPVDIADMVRDVGDLLSDPGAVTLVFKGETIIETDATPLHTILLNLVSNAAKHRDRDHVTITVAVEQSPSGWNVSISDDGPGIPKRYQQQVFELFKTLQSRDDVEGSGLGLAMVEKLVGHLEGTITLVSNPEKERGTTFILHIPAPHTPSVKETERKGAAA